MDQLPEIAVEMSTVVTYKRPLNVYTDRKCLEECGQNAGKGANSVRQIDQHRHVGLKGLFLCCTTP